MNMYKFEPDCSVQDAGTGKMVPIPQGIHNITWEGTISKVGNSPECTINIYSQQISIRTLREEIIRLCEEHKASKYP